MLFDSHAHLGAPDLYGEAADILERARRVGVEGVIAVGAGWGVSQNAYAVALADDHADVWATTGLHPHDASQWNGVAERAIDGWLNHPRVVAVGECGLDYWYEHSPRDAQRECLRAQIALSIRRELPLVIHVRASRGARDAFEELLRIFDEENADRAGGVIHCFTGDLPFARECLGRGFDISFSGIITFPSAGELREVAAALPLERLLVETDSPLLAPVPHRGRRNEPAYLAPVVDCLAELQGATVEATGACTAERARHVFGIAPSA